jgi:hypothetical protein
LAQWTAHNTLILLIILAQFPKRQNSEFFEPNREAKTDDQGTLFQYSKANSAEPQVQIGGLQPTLLAVHRGRIEDLSSKE